MLAAGFGIRESRDTAVRIEEISHSYQDYRYRAPYKFGGFSVDRVTLINVECVVSLANGRQAKGSGSMTMGNVWFIAVACSFLRPDIIRDESAGGQGSCDYQRLSGTGTSH